MHISHYSVLTILVVQSLSLSAATVHIKNLSKEPTMALINDQTSAGWDEEGKALMTGLGVVGGIGTAGLIPAAFALAGIYDRRADVKLIKPGESRFFNSDLSPITKVTFFRIMSDIPSTPYIANSEKEAEQVVSYILKKYGFPPFVSEKRKKPRGQSERAGLPYKSQQTNLYTMYIPKVETFTINPDIGKLVVEARVEYYGWGKAKRIKVQPKALQKIEKGFGEGAKKVEKGIAKGAKDVKKIFGIK